MKLQVNRISRSIRRTSIDYRKKYCKRVTCVFCTNVRGLIRRYGLFCCRNCFKENCTAFNFTFYS